MMVLLAYLDTHSRTLWDIIHTFLSRRHDKESPTSLCFKYLSRFPPATAASQLLDDNLFLFGIYRSNLCSSALLYAGPSDGQLRGLVSLVLQTWLAPGFSQLSTSLCARAPRYNRAPCFIFMHTYRSLRSFLSRQGGAFSLVF